MQVFLAALLHMKRSSNKSKFTRDDYHSYFGERPSCLPSNPDATYIKEWTGAKYNQPLPHDDSDSDPDDMDL